MAFEIQFNNSTGYAQIPALTSSTVVTADYEIEWVGKNLSTATNWVAGSIADTQNGISIVHSGEVKLRLDNVNYSWPSAVANPDDQLNKYRFHVTFDGASTKEVELFVDDVSKGSKAITGGYAQTGIAYLNRIGPVFGHGVLQSFKFTDNRTAANNQNYQMNEGSGTVINDSSGNAEHGTLFGGYTWAVSSGNNVVTVPDAPTANYIYQRDLNGNSPVVLPISFTGSPTQLEYRLLDAADDSTEIITWTIFDAAPTGGTSSLGFDAPSSLTKYHVEVRSDVDLNDTSLQTVDWSAGVKILVYGQSLSAQMSSVGTVTPSPHYYVFNGTSFVTPTIGAGNNAIAQTIIDTYGCTCAILTTGVTGTALTEKAAIGVGHGSNYWVNKASVLFSSTVSKMGAFTNNDGMIEFALWIQGQTDAVYDVNTQEYLGLNDVTGLNQMLTNSRELWSAPDTPLPFILSTLGRNTGSSTDSKAQFIRDALLAMCNADDNIRPLQIFHLPTADGTHLNEAGYIDAGTTTAAINSVMRGDIISAPVPVSAEINGATVSINFDATLDSSVTNYDVSCVAVFESTVKATVSSMARVGAKKIDVVLSAAIVDKSNVDVIMAYGTGAGQALLGYPRGASVALPAAGGAVKLPIENFNIKLKEV